MKRLAYITLFISMLLSSCTKEEYIDFIPSENDTIQWVYSHDLSGIYYGFIFDIKWVSQNSYMKLNQYTHQVEIVPLTYEKHSFKNITNYVQSDADVDVFRYDSLAYVYFNKGSMTEGLSPDTVFTLDEQLSFNGRWASKSGFLQYFIEYTKPDSTVVHQLYEGYLQK